jgi:hypothetical protein
MDTTTPTTLRARLIANAAADERTARKAAGSSMLGHDPFAGDDILWAEEDWADHAAMHEDAGLRFWSGLMLGLAVSAVAWFALAGFTYLAYRVIA